ncbi:MAG: MaoC family dehydratase [Thermodesulfobacteriota bacterium]
MLKKLNGGDSLPEIEKDIDQELIWLWAKLSGDYNRLHIDPEYARQTPYKGTIAHGPMALAFLNELMMKSFGRGWAKGGQLMDVRFVAPIRPGDRIRVEGLVKEIRIKDGQKQVVCELAIKNQQGERKVIGKGLAFLQTEEE